MIVDRATRMWIVKKALEEVKQQKAKTMFRCDGCCNYWTSMRYITDLDKWLCSVCYKKRKKILDL